VAPSAKVDFAADFLARLQKIFQRNRENWENPAKNFFVPGELA
jgi:hypothetical protein